ncbi:hypothetical protein ILUMI_24181 [Ignelater luminosus]|uniref:SAM domain-containing protein n=1 Tax=Ignelater luminosus TaxID=2038154 RepID=A0A8K0FWN5_IGNLU|nr:hypothetical protein ILUMI_24181 [Ignelater luminosus]
MDEVETLLKEWGLQELVQQFVDQGIDMEIFNNLSDDMIKELIPKIGTRCKFLQKWKLYVSSAILTDNIFTSIRTIQPSTSISVANDVVLADDRIGIESTNSTVSRTSTPSNNSFESQEFNQEEATAQCIKSKNVIEILQTSPKGKSILSIYKIKKSL